jgi:hypothetical protein
MRRREGVLTTPFIGWGNEPRGWGRVKRRPTMASMANGFKALRGREGVTGSAHSRGVKAMGQQLESHLHGARGGRRAAQRRTGGGWQLRFG